VKVSLNEMQSGDFFEYQGPPNEAPILYQKISPDNPNFNSILINQGKLCNLCPISKVFMLVSVAINIEKDTNN
jgi:hypothetical protein